LLIFFAYHGLSLQAIEMIFFVVRHWRVGFVSWDSRGNLFFHAFLAFLLNVRSSQKKKKYGYRVIIHT